MRLQAGADPRPGLPTLDRAEEVCAKGRLHRRQRRDGQPRPALRPAHPTRLGLLDLDRRGPHGAGPGHAPQGLQLVVDEIEAARDELPASRGLEVSDVPRTSRPGAVSSSFSDLPTATGGPCSRSPDYGEQVGHAARRGSAPGRDRRNVARCRGARRGSQSGGSPYEIDVRRSARTYLVDRGANASPGSTASGRSMPHGGDEALGRTRPTGTNAVTASAEARGVRPGRSREGPIADEPARGLMRPTGDRAGEPRSALGRGGRCAGHEPAPASRSTRRRTAEGMRVDADHDVRPVAHRAWAAADR